MGGRTPQSAGRFSQRTPREREQKTRARGALPGAGLGAGAGKGGFGGPCADPPLAFFLLTEEAALGWPEIELDQGDI